MGKSVVHKDIQHDMGKYGIQPMKIVVLLMLHVIFMLLFVHSSS